MQKISFFGKMNAKGHGIILIDSAVATKFSYRIADENFEKEKGECVMKKALSAFLAILLTLSPANLRNEASAFDDSITKSTTTESKKATIPEQKQGFFSRLKIGTRNFLSFALKNIFSWQTLFLVITLYLWIENQNLKDRLDLDVQFKIDTFEQKLGALEEMNKMKGKIYSYLASNAGRVAAQRTINDFVKKLRFKLLPDNFNFSSAEQFANKFAMQLSDFLDELEGK